LDNSQPEIIFDILYAKYFGIVPDRRAASRHQTFLKWFVSVANVNVTINGQRSDKELCFPEAPFAWGIGFKGCDIRISATVYPCVIVGGSKIGSMQI
jgi:hypothetical protein